MCMWSTPQADGWEMRSRSLRQRPAGDLMGDGRLLEFTSASTSKNFQGPNSIRVAAKPTTP